MLSWIAKCARYAAADGIPRRSVTLAVIVGTIINLINQGDALIGGTHVNLFKIGLTYCVPYAVSTYAAVSYRLALEARRKTAP
jgi:hypothetical protein